MDANLMHLLGFPDGPRMVEKKLQEDLARIQKELRTTMFNLAGVYTLTNKREKSFQMLEKLLEEAADAEEKAHYLVNVGRLMEQIGDFPSAIKNYRAALMLEPTDQDNWYFTHNNLGYSLIKVGEYTEALFYCQEAIKINPKRHNAYKNLAISQEGVGNFKEAADNYIKATQICPHDLRALYHLSDLLTQNPELLKSTPGLVATVENLRVIPGASKIIDPILEEYQKHQD